MPTPTPNRGYPAPVSSDPANVPGALQDLAKAVDTDLATFPDLIRPRPFFRLSASAPQKMVFSTSQRLLFTDLEENAEGALLTAPVMPVTEVRLTAGCWLLTATCAYGPPAVGALDEILLRLFSTGVAGQLAGQTVHSTPNAADGTRTISVTTLAFVSPPDDVYAQLDFHRVGVIDPAMYPLFSRSLTGLKVSDS
ncbi:hypothetical protein ABZ456_29010 [Streptomyces sp. NPDC005776]|uniref:hypothetical protein n=1 Tax=Streptomyces sp. NPDC005776 TaxID=3154676 RepID=UPI0033D2C02C